MVEMKKALKRMGVYYMLLLLSIVATANIIPDTFPTRNFSAIYLLILCVCLVLYHSHRVLRTGGLSVMMRSLSWMALLLILLRGIKYSAVAGVGVLARHTWYLYYVPMLLSTLLFFYISLSVSPKDNQRFPKKWLWALAVSAVFIALVLTNDLHQLVFRFEPGFVDWDNHYSHGSLFYVLTVWQYALYLAGVVILIIKCRISSAKKQAWILLIPFSVGILLNVLLLTGTMPQVHGTNAIEFPEALFFTLTIVLECCIQLGLIPTNTDYGKLFRRFSIAAQITDQKGTPVYASAQAVPLTAEQFAAPNGARIAPHTVLHQVKIPGGFGFWQDDMTEIDRLNEELAQAKKDLAQEAELIRLRNELKEKQSAIEQRTLVYDAIAQRTARQSQAISRLAEESRTSEDAALKDRYRYRITLLGAYIKRFANLMLLSQESNTIEAGELGLSVSEVLRYLTFCSIPGELFNNADCTVDAAATLAVFETFENLIESNFDRLKGAFVNLSEQGEKLLFKLTLENLKKPLTPAMEQELAAVGVTSEAQQESGVAYLCFTLPKGGEGA